MQWNVGDFNVFYSFAVGFMLCHQQLQHPEASELWKQALHGGYITTLCRDEVMHAHLFIINFFETIKGWVTMVTQVIKLYQCWMDYSWHYFFHKNFNFIFVLRYSKKVAEVKEFYQRAVSATYVLHTCTLYIFVYLFALYHFVSTSSV